MKYTTNCENLTNTTTNANIATSSSSLSSSSTSSSISSTTNTTNGGNTNTTGNALFCEQVNTVTNLFEKWNDCERTVVMYALLKRLRYPSLKFLQYSIDNTLTQNMGSTSNLSTVVVDMNANNPSYLQNLLNAYKTFHLGELVDTLSSSSTSSDKDSMPCYGSDFQITHCDERRKLYSKKEDILHEVLNMLPLLKPGNEEAKLIYISLIPLAVKDTIRQIVPTELVQQIFSYMLIHPAVSSDDRRTLNVWLRHLEDHLQNFNSCPPLNMGMSSSHHTSFMQNPKNFVGGLLLDNPTMTTSGSSATSSISSTASNVSVASSSFGNLTQNCNSTTISNTMMGLRNNDWQTIQPPSRLQLQQQQQQQQQQLLKTALNSDWSALVVKPNNNNTNNPNIGGGIVVGSTIADQLCDNLNAITLNELASSQNSLGLNINVGTTIVDSLAAATDNNGSSLVNGVAAAAASATAASATPVTTTPNIFGPQTNPIINIINNNNCSGQMLNGIDDHDTSFSKNGTEILDFDPNSNAMNNCDSCSNSSSSNVGQIHPHQQMGYASILMSNCTDHLDINRWSLDSKFAALKTRRSNSLTTQTISSSASSSNSSVVTVNDNCSNSTENLAQFANKPRSFSLSIEHNRGSLINSGSDTRLDEFKPNYIKFQTRNIGMSSIGLWLKSLRLHKYIELFKNMTYEDMLQINEDYLQSLGVTKGASHKLALCIEKLKERSQHLFKMEQELINGQLKLQAAVEELANIVLTPMKPIEMANTSCVEDNVALMFLKVVDLVCTIAQKDPYAVVDDDNISVILWILDRSIHNEAFVNHINQLKELKFKLSKLKMSLTPKLHHAKNGSNGNLNKSSFQFSRWNGKTRKSDQKNGSNDRINHRKNSNDMLNFSLSCLQQQHHHNQQMQQQQQQITDYDKYHNNNNNNNNTNNNNSNNNTQYKNSAYQNYQQQQIKQMQQQQQQQQLQPQMLQQHNHFPALPQQQPQPQQQQQQQQPQNQQHRRSLNNLIVVSGGPQQPQKMIFKPAQAVLSSAAATTTTTNNDDLQINIMKTTQQQQQQQQQPRKASLTALNSKTNNNISLTGANLEHLQQQQVASQQQQTVAMPKKTMAAVVMVSNDDLMHTAAAAATTAASPNAVVVLPAPSTPQILITINNSTQNHIMQQQQHHNMMQQQHQHQQQQQQQQQQLQLLAAAAAAVGNSCNLNVGGAVCTNADGCGVGGVGSCSNNGSVNCNNILQCSNNNCSNCCNLHPAQIVITPSKTTLNLTLPPLNENQYHPTSSATLSEISKACFNSSDSLNDINSLEQLETLCLQMTEQAIN